MNEEDVRKLAHLARLEINPTEVAATAEKLGSILNYVKQLDKVNVDGVEPMTSVTPMAMKKRQDVVNDGEIAKAIVANAPASEDDYFMVPKVIE